MRDLRLAAGLGTLLLLVALAPAAAQQPAAPAGGAPPPGQGPFEVTGFVRVVDGETIDVRLGDRRVLVGMIAADAPEGNTACGREAAALLRRLTAGGVRLEEDPQLRFDARNRRLYYVLTRDGRSVALDLVTAGVARAGASGRERATLAAAEASARAARRGCLWRDPAAPPPAPTPATTPVPGAGQQPGGVTAAALAPPEFTEDLITGGLTNPTAFAFLADGRILITEQRGTVRVIRDGALLPTPMLDITDRVNEYLDRGLLGIAADPDFAVNGFLYLLYTYENDPVDFGGPKTARLARYTASGDRAPAASEVVLLGTVTGATCNAVALGTDCIPSDSPSHSVGAVKFAPDGTLFLTTGDGAHYNFVDEDALRALQLDSLAGKVLRITPSGEGVPDNPFWSGDPNANRSKVWASGVRNAYRFNLRPGTLTPYLGDVGWTAWEEIDAASRGSNLGWPCYEGDARQSGYEPNPVCQALYARGPGAVRGPVIAWDHSAGSSAATGGAFYTGTAYPEAYRGAYFYGDYGQNFIRHLRVNAADRLVPGSVTGFASEADGPVAIEAGPDEQLYYLAITAGELRRIRHTGTIPPPTGTSYLSDLSPLSSTNGWGPVERDRSNGDLAGGDGLPLRVGGVTFAKGLGAHAVSDVRYFLGGGCATFAAVVGVDDEVGALGSVAFQVWADGVRLFDSGVLSGGGAGRPVAVSVTGRTELQLLLTDGDGSIDYDHADWADARLECGVAAPPAVISVIPAGGATGVPVTATVRATFSEPVNPVTVTTSTVTLVRQGTTTPEAATVSYDAATRTVTLDPVAALVAGVAYTVRVRGGPGGVRDLTGDPLPADRVWSFTTGTNLPPVATIRSPAASLRFQVGQLISYAGVASDPEDGPIPPAGLAWTIVLHHCPGFGTDCHVHPFLSVTGAGGAFTVPDHGDGYRFELTLTATDSGGLSSSVAVTIEPRTVRITLATAPPGLQVVFIGEAGTAPLTRMAVTGSLVTIFAPSPQGGLTFASWSDGGAPQHNITAGTADTTVTATFRSTGPPPGTSYLSDLSPLSSTNGWGPVERDRSNGDLAAGDGLPLRVAGITYAKGLGVHAVAELRYLLGGACRTFAATVGIDDEVGALGAVVFQVWGDGALLFDSGVVTGTGAGREVNVSLTGRSELRLLVTAGGGGIDYDHADWADARVVCGAGPPPTGTSYLSDLTPLSAVNGWGPVERDLGNGDLAGGDGRPLTLAGRVYTKGLGVHAVSDVRYFLGGTCSTFSADVGVDDEVGALGSVVFQVSADGVALFDSGVLRGDSATRSVSVSVAGRTELRLMVTAAAGGLDYDHADWADARVVCGAGPPAGTSYLSDLSPLSSTNGWGPVERDRANGDLAAGDGLPLRIGGVSYAKGLGVHAVSELRYLLGGRCDRFTAVVGLDDEVGGLGSVGFQVWADGVRLFDSGLLTGADGGTPVSVSVGGRAELQLLVTDGDGSIDYDHADWADAQITCR